jgi:hypothetical protein
MNEEPDIENLLSEEELEFLAKINHKIYDSLKKQQENTKYDHIDENPLDFADKHPELIHKEHITECPHEMRITLDVKINSIDEKGNLKEVKELIVKYFHVPIPTNTDYMHIATAFITKFESKLFETCTEVVKPEFDNEKPQP